MVIGNSLNGTREYYADSYTHVFTARVLERLNLDGRPAVALDRTYFYPTSGGQPNDHGTINGVPVVDVIARPDDGAILHVLDGEFPGDEAHCEIDWARRFDHLQQHTGQHLLSQAFIRAAEAETVSFHLSPDTVTIDLNVKSLASSEVERAEDIANEAVTANLPVRAWFPTEGELRSITLRKTPDGLPPGALRVVAIGDFDYNACGGTHVAHTGEVGVIKVIKLERRGAATRVEFRCGGRALADYRTKNATVNKLAADFTCGHWEIAEAVARLRSEADATRRELKAARAQLLDFEAASLAASAHTVNGWRVIRRAWRERDPAELRTLASKLTAQTGTIALLGSGGEKSQIVLARAGDATPDMRTILKSVFAALGTGKGGGSPAMAQGSAGPADLESVGRALSQAESLLT